MASTPLRIDLWDVGQGDCSVITLPSGELVVIDVGPVKSPIVDWIAFHTSLRIHSIILTHNDNDHVGALTPLLEAAKNRISRIRALFEPQRTQEKVRAIFRRAFELHEAGQLDFKRLEAPSTLWSDPSGTCHLDVVYPDTVEVELAASANKASAIIRLVANGVTLGVWPGDNLLETVSKNAGGQHTKLLHGPHHGAPQDRGRLSSAIALNNIDPERIFLSLGTLNQHSHPNIRYISSAVSRGTRVYCSEITRLCDKHRFAERRPILASADKLGLWPNHTGVPCRGCMRLTLEGNNLVPDFLEEEHRKRVDELGRPKCRIK